MGDNTSLWLPTNVTILITTKNRQKKLGKFWYHTHAWHSSAARAMRCFCELTNQSTALTPRDRARKCGEVLQRQKWKQRQVIVHWITATFEGNILYEHKLIHSCTYVWTGELETICNFWRLLPNQSASFTCKQSNRFLGWEVKEMVGNGRSPG